MNVYTYVCIYILLYMNKIIAEVLLRIWPERPVPVC